ncbi:MAG: hypothetical protein IJV39_04565 [Ruminococcus sp.]|nr:hypothetical protein [Ruminococcus sp.]
MTWRKLIEQSMLEDMKKNKLPESAIRKICFDVINSTRSSKSDDIKKSS